MNLSEYTTSILTVKFKALKCILLALAVAVTLGCGTGNAPVGTSGYYYATPKQ